MKNIIVATNADPIILSVAVGVGGGGGVSDGDKGDITISSAGTVFTIDNKAVTLAKQADMATSSVVYRKTAGSGAPEVQSLSTLKTDLGLTGTNSGDQTSIVGITGTIAQFNTAITDGDLATGGGTATGTNTGDNATNSLYSGLVSNATHTGDATGSTALTVVAINGTNLAGLSTGILKNTTSTGIPSIAVAGDFPTLNQNTTGNAATVTTNANLSGHITSVGNTTSLGSFTLAQLNTAISDADIPTSSPEPLSLFLLMGA